jgi:Bacterial archaeo-eukaryotic release factor family 11
MTLYTDIPTRSEIDALWQDQPPAAVSIYLETTPDSTGEAERIAYRNGVREALTQLGEADKATLAALADELAVLDNEVSDEFWRHQARSLAVFATPTSLHSFRLPNRLTPVAVGGPRFFVKPLMRAVTFPQVAFVLALAQGSVRLLEAVPDAAPREVRVPDMPTDVASAVGKSSISDRAPIRRVQGSEGQKMRMAQFSRQVDAALREVLPGHGVPLVLAAAEPLDSIFRAHCHYPDLVPQSLSGSPEGHSDVELVAAAREILDNWYADRLDDEKRTFAERTQQGRATTDVANLARFASQGAVDTLFVDIDANVSGRVDEFGEVTFSAQEGGSSTDVVDEVARRAWLSGARLLAVRHEDVPGGGDIAGTLRYAPSA